MTERLLQYIWQFQYFNKNELATSEGERLSILNPGTLNTNQGPDFLNARILVNDTIWVGNIELHVHSSQWHDHQHSKDSNYKNVILHVVWMNDVALNLPFPALELQAKISNLLLSRYQELMETKSFIPCEKMIHQVEPIVWISWKERLMIERLQQKAINIAGYLAQNQYHWEETFWWLIARNFGVTVNSDAFEKIARSLPLNILAKHKNQIHQTEAILFGQAGLLENDFQEDYPILLKKEYLFFKKKYKLQSAQIPLHFLRMRPSNFPTVRLAQLSMLIHNSIHLFSTIKEASHLKDVKKLLAVTANDYWHYHYRFDEPTKKREKNLGTQMVDTLIINTVLPLLFAYGQHHKEQVFKDKALSWLEQLNAEKNKITHGFTRLGIENKNALDSQALIQLKHRYCDEKRCLECAVGNKLLRQVNSKAN